MEDARLVYQRSLSSVRLKPPHRRDHRLQEEPQLRRLQISGRHVLRLLPRPKLLAFRKGVTLHRVLGPLGPSGSGHGAVPGGVNIRGDGQENEFFYDDLDEEADMNGG